LYSTVEFNVGSIKYSGEVDKYTSVMKKGDNVIVYYNPVVLMNLNVELQYFFIFIYCNCSLITLASLFFMIKTNMKIRIYKCKLNGIKNRC
jgi:hypothetical protein